MTPNILGQKGWGDLSDARILRARAKQVDAYVDTINRLEPDIASIDDVAAYASIAISLRRIADAAVFVKRLICWTVLGSTVGAGISLMWRIAHGG